VSEIDHEGSVPVYQQLAAILRAQIESGELRSGRPIPSERTLTQQYGVAVGTVKKAVEVLRTEGLVHTVIGRGIFVR
jgi:DNA-binding GntR family transcriptional regulator